MVKPFICKTIISCIKGGCNKVDSGVIADICLECKESKIIIQTDLKKDKKKEIEKSEISNLLKTKAVKNK
jgi:hypothetical protein